jgi:hypothetical protein
MVFVKFVAHFCMRVTAVETFVQQLERKSAAMFDALLIIKEERPKCLIA